MSTPKNPNEFDYRNYLNLRAVYHQAYLDSNSWKTTSENKGNQLLVWSIQLRKKLTDQVDSWQLSENEKSVSKALLLGYRHDIDNDLLKAYSSAGAMHVLAVSGLHVGIIYVVLLYLLNIFGNAKGIKRFRTLILILALWSYALVTGLSPSVVRAATMFSFVAVAAGFNRQTSVYNTIIASALLLLLIKPTYLFEVGFQLSYLAVLGIVWLQPRFNSLWQPKNWVLKQAWDITTVSLAAQLATFPFGLYYFHQFPTLFLVSNWVVIPLVSVLMYVGLFTLAISSLCIGAALLVKLYGYLLFTMNWCVLKVESLSGFLIDQIHISRLEVVLIYLVISLAFAWMFYGKFYRLVLAFVMVCALLILQVNETILLNKKSELVVHSIRNNSAVSLVNNGKCMFISNSGLDDNTMSFHIKQYWWANDVKEFQFYNWQEDWDEVLSKKRGDLIRLGSMVVWVVPTNKISDETPIADIWLVSSKKVLPPQKETKFYPEKVILHNQFSKWQYNKWEKWCNQHSVELRNVLEDGAYQQLI